MRDRLKIHILRLPNDKRHMRHFLEGLLKSPSADVLMNHQDPNGKRDYTIVDTSEYCPPNGKTIIHFGYDAHALSYDLQMESLLIPELLELTRTQGTASDFHQKALEEFRRSWKQPSIIKFADSFDVYAPMLLDPLSTQISPKLTRAKTVIVPHSVPEWIFHTALQESRDTDLVFTGVRTPAYYPLRLEVFRALPALRKTMRCDVMPYGLPSCAELERNWTHKQLDDHQVEYANRLRRSRMAAFDGSVYNYPLAKHIEYMATGCLVLAPLPRNADFLGLVDGVNMVSISVVDWKDKVRYYHEHERERAEITRNARETVLRWHTCKARAEIFIKQLALLDAGATEEEVHWHARKEMPCL